MQVRPAISEDVDRVYECHTAAIRVFGPKAYDDEQVEAWVGSEDADPDYPVNDPDHRFVVAERAARRETADRGSNTGAIGRSTGWDEGATCAGEVAGFGDLVVPEREVTAVYVHPEHAGHGVGTALLTHLEGRAREAGLGELRLLSSLNAVGFYERAGYEPERETTHETSVGVELEVVEMRKSLSGNP